MLKRRISVALPFERHERYSATAIFVMMTAALLLAAGAAVDYARVANMREGIDAAVAAAADAAAAAMYSDALSDDQVKTLAMSQFDKAVTFARHVGTIEELDIGIDRVSRSVTVDAKGTVAMTVSRLAGVNDVTVPASATAAWTPRDADVQPEQSP